MQHRLATVWGLGVMAVLALMTGVLLFGYTAHRRQLDRALREARQAREAAAAEQAQRQDPAPARSRRDPELDAPLERLRLLTYIAHVDLRPERDALMAALEARGESHAPLSAASAWWLLGDHGRARRLLTGALAEAPDDLGLRRAAAQLGVEQWLMARAAAPGSVAPPRAEDALFRAPGVASGNLADELLKIAQMLIDGRVGESLREACAGAAGRHARALGVEGFWALEGAGSDRAGSLAAYGRAIGVRHHDPLARYLRARRHHADMSLDAAVADYNVVLTLAPYHVRALVGRARAKARQGIVGEAHAELDRALAVAPGDAGALALRAQVRVRLGRLDEAESDARASARLLPGGRGAVALAAVHVARGAPQDALGALATVRDPVGLVARARLHLAAGRPGKGLADLAAAITADPGHYEAYFEQARLFAADGDAKGARRAVEAAILRAPGHAEAFYLRAVLRYDAGDTEGAVRDVDRSLSRAAGYAPAYVLRGRARLKAGNRTGARRDFRRALELDPRNAEARRRLDALDAGGRDQ